MAAQAPVGVPQRRKKKLSPAFLASLGCAAVGLLVLLVGGIVAGAYGLMVAFVTNHGVYGDAVAAAGADARVKDALGDPVEPSWLLYGTVSSDDQDGSTDLRVQLTGPKAKGWMWLEATKREGTWTRQRLEVELKDGVVIDVLETIEAPAPTAAAVDRVLEAEEALAAGDLVGAEAIASELVRGHPRRAPLWSLRGRVHLAAERLPAAEADFAKALELDAEDLDAQVGMGRIQLATEQWEQCVATITEVLPYRNRDASLWLDRARCTEGLGDLRMAVAGARQACTLGSAPGCEMADRLQ